MGERVRLQIPVLAAWLWMCSAQSCLPNIPAYSQSAVGSHPLGAQAIIPNYNFSCSGLITRIRIHADAMHGRGGFLFQTWRPQPNGTYTLQQSMEIPPSAVRDDTLITFSSELPVMSGDAIGYQLKSGVQDQIHFFFDSTATASTVQTYYLSSEETMCQVSLCDTTDLTLLTGAPSISVDFMETDITNINTDPPQCTPGGVTTPCGVTPSPDPPTTSSPSPDASSEDQSEQGSDSVLDQLTTETIIVLAIGFVLFIVLIVLVVVLVVCVCRKRKPPQYRFKNPMPGSNIGTPITNSVVSVGSAAPLTNGTAATNGHYVNAVVVENALDFSASSAMSGHHDNHQVHHHGHKRHTSGHLERNGVLPLLPPRPHSVATTHKTHPSRMTASHPPPSSLPEPPILARSFSPVSTDIPEREVSSRQTLEHSLPDSLQETLRHSYDHLLERQEGGAGPSTGQGQQVTRRYDHLTSAEGGGATSQSQEKSNQTPSKGRDHKSPRRSQYVYSYVPTEEQRRLVRFHNSGHYEVTDDISQVRGYDRLKYFEESEVYWAPATTTSGLYTQLYENKYRELPRNQIIIQNQIGSGHFGSVSKGVWQFLGENGEVVEDECVEVAVKEVKMETEEVQRVKLLQEAAIMGQFAHPNVVRLHGVVTVGDPIMIVLEYMPRGDLRSYLQGLHPAVTKKDVGKDVPKLFLKFGKDIAAGMGYLARKNFVHRDLAARNILLSNNLTCKIGDFGMARDIAGGESDYYKSHGGIIPVKWTAPESLNYNKYTSASDVWSYGMVLYEVWSLGHKPFHDLTNPIVIALVTSRHCQAPPPGCPRPIYHLMVECWNPKDTQRPTFDSIHDYLDSSEESLLQWSSEDIVPGKQAHIMGAPLVEGNNLYLDLQRTYQNQMLAQMQSSRT